MVCKGHALSFVLHLVEEKKEILQRLKLLSTSVVFFMWVIPSSPTPFLVFSLYVLASFLLREETDETIKIALKSSINQVNRETSLQSLLRREVNKFCLTALLFVVSSN